MLYAYLEENEVISGSQYGYYYHKMGRPCGSDGKENLPAMWKTCLLSLGWEDCLEEGIFLQYFCLEKPHGQRSLSTKSRTQLSD